MKNLFSNWLSQSVKFSRPKKNEEIKNKNTQNNSFTPRPQKTNQWLDKKTTKPYFKNIQNQKPGLDFHTKTTLINKSKSQNSSAFSLPADKQNFQSKPSLNPRKLLGFNEDRPFYFGPEKNEEVRLRIIPLGGTNEVGENCMAIEYGEDMILIDVGIAFPHKESLGINYYIPDLEYVYKNLHRLKAVIITHGHLDHIGAIPYVIGKLNFPPIYATKLTAGLIRNRLNEFKLTKLTKLKIFDPQETLIFGGIKIGFYRVAHSIPDAVGIYVKTETGSLVHSGDFKFCEESSDGIPQDLAKMKKLGEKNIDLLLSDSTNAHNPGRTISDKIVAENLDKAISEAKNRLIVATFSSQIGRIQEILNTAAKHHRTVFVSGKSMETSISTAKELGYLKYKEDLIQDMSKAKNLPLASTLILSTGSQGEPQASILKMINKEHKYFKILPGDTVIFSSSSIPGNETQVYEMVNNLSRLGATIIHNKILPIHTSGHAYIEECRDLIKLIKPKFFAPIHGTHFMRSAHKNIALQEGLDQRNIFLIDNGDILEIHKGNVKILNKRVPAKYVIVDGKSIGVDGTQVINDRKAMSEGGVLIIKLKINRKIKDIQGLTFVSRGLFYENEYKKIEKELTAKIYDSYKKFINENSLTNTRGLEEYLTKTTKNFISRKMDRYTLVVPIVEFGK